MLKEIFEDVELNIDAGFNQEWVEDAHFIPTGNRFFSDDQLSGSYPRLTVSALQRYSDPGSDAYRENDDGDDVV